MADQSTPVRTIPPEIVGGSPPSPQQPSGAKPGPPAQAPAFRAREKPAANRLPWVKTSWSVLVRWAFLQQAGQTVRLFRVSGDVVPDECWVILAVRLLWVLADEGST